MTTHKTTFTSEPMVNEYERIVTEQFVQASTDYQKYAEHASTLGKILMDAGIPPDTRTALGLIVCAIGVLRSNNVNAHLIMEATGAILAAAHGPLVPGGLQRGFADIADKRADRLKFLLGAARKNHRLEMSLDDDVEGAPLTIVVQHVREDDGTYRIDASVNYHGDAKDPGSGAPDITLRTALEIAAAAVKAGLEQTTDPKAVN